MAFGGVRVPEAAKQVEEDEVGSTKISQEKKHIEIFFKYQELKKDTTETSKESETKDAKKSSKAQKQKKKAKEESSSDSEDSLFDDDGDSILEILSTKLQSMALKISMATR